MAILLWLLISMILISVLPQLIYLIMIVWVVGTIVRALRPRPRNPYEEMRKEYQQRTRTNNQEDSQRQNKPTDVIDVEYKERDVEE